MISLIPKISFSFFQKPVTKGEACEAKDTLLHSGELGELASAFGRGVG